MFPPVPVNDEGVSANPHRHSLRHMPVDSDLLGSGLSIRRTMIPTKDRLLWRLRNREMHMLKYRVIRSINSDVRTRPERVKVATSGAP